MSDDLISAGEGMKSLPPATGYTKIVGSTPKIIAIDQFIDRLHSSGQAAFFLELAEAIAPEESSEEEVEKTAVKLAEYLQNIPESTKSWSDFDRGWRQFAADTGINANGLYEGFLKNYAEAVGLKMDGTKEATEGDWKLLDSTHFPVDFSNPESRNNPFVMSFNAFLSGYSPTKIDKEAGFDPDNLAEQFRKFLSSKVNIPLEDRETNSFSPTSGISYESLYRNFTSDTSKEGFQSNLNKFYDSQIETRGYFIPGHSFEDWGRSLLTEQSNRAFRSSASVDSSSSLEIEAAQKTEGAGETEEALDINDVFDLFMAMILALEDLAIAQANRITFYTDYQNAYTQLQGDIPYLSSGDVGPSSGEDEDDEWVAFRNDFNQNKASVLNQNLQAERGIQEDNASKQQTYLNSTTSAINDTVNQMNAFLDMLGRIRDKIFK